MLPGDPSVVIDEAVEPDLAEHLGHDLVTSDGTTLLGADDKGGVAEIMAAAAYLARHPEIPHGPVRIAFTPDEEIGAGTEHFDLERFGAAAAYTLDGSGAGEIEDETFSALQARVRVPRGERAHGHGEGPPRERGQGGRRLRLPPAARPLARGDGGPRRGSSTPRRSRGTRSAAP